ncbi:superoxide dismutase family protein [Streptomyces sp. NPDC091212]|uniref:superoxide dismutase family protein n=1 Tax=Streptomyces sp. NPDC091212 TaxID=3155191 RepID=UPI0034398AF3
MRTCSKAATAVAVTTALAFALPAATASAHGDPVTVRAEGRFVTPASAHPSDALTYDTRTVPVGARISVTERVERLAGGPATTVVLKVSGLLPGRAYGAHVHTEPCGPSPDDSGPHYQNVPDPRQPSTDPAYANPVNEVWLDFTTDARGTGAAVSRHHWRFRQGGAHAVVIHEHGTATDSGDAGTAGARAGCLTVPFESGVRGTAKWTGEPIAEQPAAPTGSPARFRG